MENILKELVSGPYFYLCVIAIILLSTKVLGLASRKVNMPAVVGALIAGVILGPSLLGIVDLNVTSISLSDLASKGISDSEYLMSTFISSTSELGVILLMFASGLETDLDELKANGISAFIVAAIGVIVPLFGGMGIFYVMNPEGLPDINFFKALFVGVTLTATSVSITVETLREMGKLSGKMGTTILGAAVIDDIIGIIVLTAIISVGSESNGGGDASLSTVLIKILLFFVFIAVVGVIILIVKKVVHSVERKRRISIFAFAFCLFLSYASEEFFGVADITGAYFAGVLLCNFGVKHYIGNKFEVMSYLYASPIFFASIGLKTNLHNLTSSMFLFAVVLVIVAILTKVIGCGLGAKICKFNNKDALAIGIGMVSRGEVALIVAQKGEAAGLLGDDLFPAVVFMVIVTTLITPILLKVILKDKKPKEIANA